MWLILREGINVIKHGRKGNPGRKVLFCDFYMTKFYWRSPGSKPDKDDVELFSEHMLPGSLYTSTTFSSDNDLFADTVPLMSKSYSGPHEPKRRSSFFGTANRRSSLTKGDADRVLFLKDIVEVRSDCSSEVLQRAVSKNHVGVEEGYNILSVITHNRSLDLEVKQVRIYVLYAIDLRPC